MKALALFAVAFATASAAKAASYIPQASFSVTGSTVAGMDRDAAGNLYVLARMPGTATSYTVTSYQTPAMTPEFSFAVSITTPIAFAVEANGVVDVLDTGGGLTLSRYDNTGAIVSQVGNIVVGLKGNYFAAAIDKTNGVFYFSYPYAVIQDVGDFGFKVLYDEGAIGKYNFSGQLQTTFFEPGRTTISTSCYTPSFMAVDSQSNLWIADPVCAQLLEYTPQGAQQTDDTLPYIFVPKSMWTGPNQSLFLTNNVCDGVGCPQLFQFNTGGVEQYGISTTSIMGETWDARTLYVASPSGGTIQRFILDTPPTAPVPSSPQGFTLQHSSEATLSWQAASDADGDPLLYSVYIGTSTRSLGFAGSTSSTLFVSTPLAFGTTYYWQVTAQDSYLTMPMLTSTGAIVGFGQNFLDSPPGAFSVASGTGTVVTRSTSVTFGWSPSADAYGDAILYNVSWRQVGQSSAAASTSATSLTVGGLSFGATVYWSVTACDPYGYCAAMSGGTQAYDPVFLNPPPPAPTVTGGVGVVGEHTLTPAVTLSWLPVVDALGDAVSYQVELGTVPASFTTVQLGTATSYGWSGLAYGTTYYWAVAAQNPYGAASTSTVQTVQLVLQDAPPGAFAVVSGTGTLATRTTDQLLAWSAAADVYGDTVTYALSVSTTPGRLCTVQTSTATSFLLTIQYGTTYYWSVAATDPYGFSTAITGGTQTFFATFLDAPPATVQLAAPPVISTMRGTATVSWQAVTNAQGDPVGYTFYFGDTASGLVPIAEIAASTATGIGSAAVRPLVGTPPTQTQVNGSTVSVTLTGLAYDHTYFVQVQAADPYGGMSVTPLQSFSIAPESGFPAAYNYPNPFSPSHGGTNIVFNAPASGFAKATVEIFSEWQDLLFKQDYYDIPPGVSQVPFNGLDRRGRAFFNGSYICRVKFSGPDQQVTFFMAVVK